MTGDRTKDDATAAPTHTDRLHAKRQPPRSELHHVDRTAEAFIQQRPFAALFAAVVAGYLVARLASRY
jgi:hypothetical protein